VRATHGIDSSGAGATSPARVHEWPVFCSSLRLLLLVGGWMLWAATANADALFVSNFNTNTILRFDLAGNPTSFADASDGLLMPDSMVFDARGNLFVANRGARNILRFDPLGNPSVFADASDGLLAPFALAFDSTGNLFVANATGGGLTGNNNILRFDPAGNATVFADPATASRTRGAWRSIPKATSLSLINSLLEVGGPWTEISSGSIPRATRHFPGNQMHSSSWMN
jgi:hypothetical protein